MSMSADSAYTVRAAHCDYRASEDEIYDTVCRITSPLGRSWERIENARRVIWHGPDPTNLGSRRKLSGAHKDHAPWMKWVDPEEVEGENFEVYDRILGDLA